MDQNEFMADNKGKCGKCELTKPLDEMVRQHKGNYSCVDCETEKWDNKYNNFNNLNLSDPETQSKLSKLFKWACG